MLELLTFLFVCFFIYCVSLSNIKVSKDTDVPYKATNNLGIYLKEETGQTFYFKIPFGLNKPIWFYLSRTELTTPDHRYREEELLEQDKICLQVIIQYQRPTRLNLLSLQVLSLQVIALADLHQQPKKVALMALSLNIEYTPANPPINKAKYFH
jgi:hypothetical protein